MRRIYIHHNNSRASIRAKDKLIQTLKEHGFTPTRQNPDVIVVVGGDGTMLSAIRSYGKKGIPFIGINTGTLGFLPSLLPKDIDRLMVLLKKDTLEVHDYPLLEVVSRTIHNKETVDFAFNEIVIKHQQPKLMEALVYLDGKPFNYFTGDGFIVSTPVGATGYAIWAGGVAVHSDLPVYQITPMNPNDNRINRPMKTSMIIPLDTKVDFKVIKANHRAVIVACDGRQVTDDYISEIHIKVSEQTARILRVDGYDYFELFRRKIIDKKVFRYLK